MTNTPIYFLDLFEDNRIYIKREDMIPFSFGGNKARKAVRFMKEAKEKNADCIVTYGSFSSNHCRIIANAAAQAGLRCYMISPESEEVESFNSDLTALFGAVRVICPLDRVKETIDETLAQLEAEGRRPYFIMGGGHGVPGTEAFVECYEEIREYEKEQDIFFDYIFHASGTGTTQSGLVCGQWIAGEERKIIGISIARKNPRGRDVVLESAEEYLQFAKIPYEKEELEKILHFTDEYINGGYGKSNEKIQTVIRENMIKYGIPMDETYVGKAFWGMKEWMQKEGIRGKNVLFIHTGGTPLFFDFLRRE